MQVLACEIFKDKSNVAPEIMCNIFSFKTVSYNLRNDTILNCRDANTVVYGSELISFLGPKIWARLTPEMRNIKFPVEFKNKIQEWTQTIVCVDYAKSSYKTLVFSKHIRFIKYL